MDDSEQPIRTVVWGTGNVGRAAIRAVDAHPGLRLAGVIVANPDKVGRDAGALADAGRDLGVAATSDVDAVLGDHPGAVVYAVSGDVRPDEAAGDVARALRAGAVVVTPSIYALYDHRSAPAELRDPLAAAAAEGGGALFVSGIDPGWGNDVLPILLTGLAGTIDSVRCQEIFDYTAYDQPEAVRNLIGMGRSMDEMPMMVAPSVPTMVWGGQVRLMARALGVEVEEIRETLDRRALEQTVETDLMGTFDAGTQGGLRFEIQGIVGGEPRIVVEHITRIHPSVAPDWPVVADGGAGAHTVIIEGRPRIEVTVSATDEGDNRAAGGNATAVARLVNAIPWLRAAAPGLYDALEVPLTPAAGRLGVASSG
jgi:2,4-diaminopentanoate dehydrogenase